jgi:non-heme chloroperoxidase
VLISPFQPFLLKTKDNPTGIDKSVFDGIQETILEDRFAYLTQFNNDFFNVDENLGKTISQDALN